MQLFIQKISIAIFNKNIHNQNDAQKSGQLRYIKKLSIALVQTKVINCNFANKVVSCNLCTQKLSQLRRNLAIFCFISGKISNYRMIRTVLFYYDS